MNNCCKLESNQILIDGVFACQKCCVQIGSDLDQRIEKFEEMSANFLLKKRNLSNFLDENNFLPSWVKITVLELLPKILNGIQIDKNRANFINLNQLMYSLLPMIGASEYQIFFPKLKTKTRVKNIENILETILNQNISKIPNQRLCDIDLISPTGYENHIETRIPTNINKVYT